ncbi:MAG TPA: GNAT family N-acetyltransferase [Jatrophihabitantaceae bacterium]|nr:GNAT family N-acetyltransferase [Jatrophihabitantaceae bacterium]
MVMTAPETPEIDAVRSDGGLVHIRTVTPEDLPALHELHSAVSDRSIYLRFFSLSRATADAYVDSLARPATAAHQALVASIRGRIVGLAVFERVGDAAAEFALLVADDCRHEGIGTLLLEHLASVARHAGISTFVGEVLAENAAMIEVLHALGFDMRLVPDRDVLRVEFDLEPRDRALFALADRERAADAASLRPLLDPRSVAVIGAGTKPGSVGRQVLANIIDGGFTGAVYAVNPRHKSVLGVPCFASPDLLPIPVDLVVIAVPAPAVPDLLRECGVRGVRAAVLLTAGFGESGHAGAALQDSVLSVAREYGIRLVGPNCVGVVNTAQGVSLDATFARLPMKRGTFALLSQSGAFGIGFLIAAARRGVGISQFVSIGNKADVSGNDLLLAWECDSRTQVIGMYLESVGNARKFARIARRVAGRKPILAIKSGRTSAGQRAGASHTAAAATSDVAMDAMFAEAGVIRVSSIEEMLDASRVLTDQPAPAGPGVLIVGNSGGPGILAADAAAAAGLNVLELDEQTMHRLRECVPSAASVQNPIDLGAAVAPRDIAAALQVVLDAPGVDAVLTVFTDVAVTDADALLTEIALAAAHTAKPVVATQVGGEQQSIDLPGTARSLPVFEFPESAAAALGVAYRYSLIRGRDTEPVVPPTDTDHGAAKQIVESALAASATWLDPAQVARLLGSYGISTAAQRVAHDADSAVAAADEIGYPVALKVSASAVVHKTDVGGVRLGLADADGVREAVADIDAAVSIPHEFLVQQMSLPGVELIIGAVRDPHVGPMVMVGAGGILADLVDDRAFRLAPLRSGHAAEMIAGLRCSRLLDGYRGRPAADRDAVRDVLVRVAALVSEVPEIVELDLNPLVCTPGGVVVVDARVHLAPPPDLPDPFVRELRTPKHSKGTS